MIKKILFLLLVTLLLPAQVVLAQSGVGNCSVERAFLNVDDVEDCADLPEANQSACRAFVAGKTSDQLDEAKEQIRKDCIVTIEYEIPTIVAPDGVPQPPNANFEDVSDLRRFFIDNFFPRVTRLLIWGIGLVVFAMLLYAGIRIQW